MPEKKPTNISPKTLLDFLLPPTFGNCLVRNKYNEKLTHSNYNLI